MIWQWWFQQNYIDYGNNSDIRISNGIGNNIDNCNVKVKTNGTGTGIRHDNV